MGVSKQRSHQKNLCFQAVDDLNKSAIEKVQYIVANVGVCDAATLLKAYIDYGTDSRKQDATLSFQSSENERTSCMF